MLQWFIMIYNVVFHSKEPRKNRMKKKKTLVRLSRYVCSWPCPLCPHRRHNISTHYFLFLCKCYIHTGYTWSTNLHLQRPNGTLKNDKYNWIEFLNWKHEICRSTSLICFCCWTHSLAEISVYIYHLLFSIDYAVPIDDPKMMPQEAVLEMETTEPPVIGEIQFWKWLIWRLAEMNRIFVCANTWKR